MFLACCPSRSVLGLLLVVLFRRFVAGRALVRRLHVELVLVRDVGVWLLRLFGHGLALPRAYPEQTAAAGARSIQGARSRQCPGGFASRSFTAGPWITRPV